MCVREGLHWSDLLTPRSGTGCKQANIYDTFTVTILGGGKSHQLQFTPVLSKLGGGNSALLIDWLSMYPVIPTRSSVCHTDEPQ